MPSINQNICGSWNEQQTDLYNKMPFYLMEAQSQYRKQWEVYSKLLTPVSWKPNMGPIMRRVMAEPQPLLRQEATPQLISQDPLTDISTYRERTADAKLRWQDFVSPHFPFLPEFQDFLKHITECQKNLDRQITLFEDIFYRSMLYHHAPYVYVCGYGLIEAPIGDPASDGTGGKSDAWLQWVMSDLVGAQPGELTFEELWNVFNAAESDIGMTPFEGTGKPGADSSPLNEKYCMVQSGESWNNWFNDPWVKENRPLNMNIVTDAFKGDIFGRIRSRIERFPLRYAVAEDYSVQRYAPEEIELNPDRLDQYQRTRPKKEYSYTDISQVEVGMFMGGSCADYIQVGPPPSEFTKDVDSSVGAKMNWNGKSETTKNFLIPCKDSNGNTVYQANSFGRYLRIQANLALGISLINTQNVLPVIYKRKRRINGARAAA